VIQRAAVELASVLVRLINSVLNDAAPPAFVDNMIDRVADRVAERLHPGDNVAGGTATGDPCTGDKDEDAWRDVFDADDDVGRDPPTHSSPQGYAEAARERVAQQAEARPSRAAAIQRAHPSSRPRPTRARRQPYTDVVLLRRMFPQARQQYAAHLDQLPEDGVEAANVRLRALSAEALRNIHTVIGKATAASKAAMRATGLLTLESGGQPSVPSPSAAAQQRSRDAPAPVPLPPTDHTACA
jgi:hypothetical protein